MEEIKDPRQEGIGGLQGLNRSKKYPTLEYVPGEYGNFTQEVIENTPAIENLGNRFPSFSKYDEDIVYESQIDNLNEFRANQQSNLLKATNAVIGGVLSGLATAVEDFSYILDFEEWGKVFSGQDTLERNWLGQAMADAKEALYGAMPIYERERKDTFSDNFFRWSTLRSGLDSMVGFAVPGGAISKGLSLGTKALRASRAAAYLSKLAETNKIAKGLDKGLNFLTTGPSGEVVNSLVSGMLTNDAEGK